MTTAIYLQGRKGRMGTLISSLIEQESRFSISSTVAAADVVLDFSAPSALEDLLKECIELKKPLVIGTTGYQAQERALIEAASHHIPLFYTPNFSFGMALMHEMVEMITSKMDDRVGIEIIEAHHHHKKDQPSGSALSLAQIAGRSSLPIHSIRMGDITGDHTIIFGFEGERLEIKHQAHSRTPFAWGALQAVQFIRSQMPGYYTMKDLLHASR